MCGALAILSKLSEWLHTKDVSQLVLTSWEIFVESPDVEILSHCGCSRHLVQVRARDAGTCATRSNKAYVPFADKTKM